MQIISSLLMLASAEHTIDGQTSGFKVSSARSIRFFVDVTANATGTAIQFYIEGSPDDSTWFKIPDASALFDPLTGVRTKVNSEKFNKYVENPPLYVRIRWDLTNAVTFSIRMTKNAR